MDPLSLSLLSIFGGAGLTASAGLFGAWIQSRREHEKWVRERRYNAFVRVLDIMDRLSTLAQQATSPSDFEELREAALHKGDKLAAAVSLIERSDALKDELNDAIAPVLLLGPESVREALLRVTEAMKSGDEEAARGARRDVIRLMQQTLGVKTS